MVYALGIILAGPVAAVEERLASVARVEARAARKADTLKGTRTLAHAGLPPRYFGVSVRLSQHSYIAP